MADRDEILRQLIDLGRQIINKGLALRRAADNISPEQFERTLRVAASAGTVAVQGPSFEFTPPPGEFRGDVDRINWVEGRKSVVRELAVLDVDASTWLTGGDALADAGGKASFDPQLWGYYVAVADELGKLREWTIPAAEYAKGNLPPIGGGSAIAAQVISLFDSLGLNIERLLNAGPKIAFGIGAVALLLIVLLLIRK